MASLVSLPNELKDLIFQHLSCADFIRLSLTCRELHASSLSLGYRDLTLTWANAHEQVVRKPKLQSLLRTLIQRPDYATHIQSLRFEALRCLGFMDDSYLRVDIPGSDIRLNGKEETILRRAVSNLGLSEDKSWVNAIVGHQQFFVVMAMVVAHCTKLESLDLSVAFLLQNDWFEEIIQKGLVAGSGLSAWMASLKHVRLTCDTDGDEWSPESLDLQNTALYPFYLPKLETLEIARFELPYHDPQDWGHDREAYATWFWPISPTSPPVASHLTTLRLLRSSVLAHSLELVLKQTPNLSVFELDIFLWSETRPFDFTALGSSLGRLQASLTHLTVRFEVYLNYDEDARDVEGIIEGSLGSLRNYTALTHLEVSLHTLMGFEHDQPEHSPSLAAMLPPNLQSLTITDDLWMFNDYQESLEDLQAMKIFRRYLTGEEIKPDWQADYWDRRSIFLTVGWVPETSEGEWRTATPQLKKFVYDLRKRGYLSGEYWNKGMVRKQFRTMCKQQGLEGEVLWEKIQYIL